jgi:hypothetical protein
MIEKKIPDKISHIRRRLGKTLSGVIYSLSREMILAKEKDHGLIN